MEYHKEPHRVYSLIYHLIVVGKYRQHVFLENSGIIEAVKTKIVELSKNFRCCGRGSKNPAPLGASSSIKNPLDD